MCKIYPIKKMTIAFEWQQFTLFVPFEYEKCVQYIGIFHEEIQLMDMDNMDISEKKLIDAAILGICKERKSDTLKCVIWNFLQAQGIFATERTWKNTELSKNMFL